MLLPSCVTDYTPIIAELCENCKEK